MTALYDAATAGLARLGRFSSAINRVLPDSQPQARVWFSANRVVAATDRSSATGILDAWTPLGPGNIGGRTRVVRFHPIVHTTLFAAGVSGGVWKSDDNGITWRPTGDGLANIAVNALAIDPQRPSVMFAGTGEGYFREEIRGTGLPLRGGGIFVSNNEGGSWQRLPATNSPDFHWVNDLELGVADPRRIYAATRSGVWRSRDAGQTWERLLETSVRGGCLDLALRPDRSEDVLFASCGSYEQATVYRFPRASERDEVDVVLREPGMGRTSLAIAASNPDVMYALAASNDEGPGGNYRQGLLAVYRSDRGGTAGSWQARVTNQDATLLHTLLLTNAASASVRVCNPQSPNAANSVVNMGWYTNVIAVDPRDPDRVWAAGVDWFRSDDGGRTWGLASWGGSGASYAHVDQHAIDVSPAVRRRRQSNGAHRQRWRDLSHDQCPRGVGHRPCVRRAAAPASPCAWSSLNRGYGVTQFYHGTPFPDGSRYFGGTQDNGTILGGDGAGADGWRPIYGGDGGFTAVNPQATQTLYAEFQWSSLARSNDGGTTFTAIRNGLDPVRSDNARTRCQLSLRHPAGDGSRRSRSACGLAASSSTGTTNGAQTGWTKVGAAMPDGSLVSAIAIAPGGNGQVVAVGTNRGHVLRTVNGLANQASATAFDTSRPREGWVTSIAFDPNDSNTFYATYGNFGGGHVFRTSNGGVSWQGIDGVGPGALPDVPVHSLVVDPNDSQRLYLGTDLGVMTSIDGGRTWMVEETGFGPAVTMWLSLTRTPSGETFLFAFTHGRGAWRVRLR